MGEFKKRFAKMKYVPKEFYRDCDKSIELPSSYRSGNNFRIDFDSYVVWKIRLKCNYLF